MRHQTVKAKKLMVNDHFRLGGKLFRVDSLYQDETTCMQVHAYPINEWPTSILLVLPPKFKLKIFNQ